MKNILISCLISLVLLLGFTVPAFGKLEGELECQYTNDQLNYSLEGDYWFANQWGFSGNYSLQDHCLSAAILYQVNPVFKGTTTYIGLGIRDLNDSYHSGLSLAQKLELRFGAAYQLTNIQPGLTFSLDARIVPNELFNGKQSDAGFAPILGLAIGYQFPETGTHGNTNPETVSDNDLNLLAKLITAEAGDESYEGQVAVGAVVLNRTKSGEFPTTIREVIYQPGQFSSLPKLSTITPSESCIKAAREALNGADPSRGALYFYNPATCSAEGLQFFSTASLRITVRIGNHLFLK